MLGRLADFQQVAWIVNSCAMILVLARVMLTGLWRTYPRLVVYLWIDAINTFLPLVVPLASAAYGISYMILRAANILVGAGVVLELYRLALAHYPALAGFGRRVAGYALASAGTIAILTVILDLKVLDRQSVLLHRFFTVERTMDLAELVFLIFISGFLLWFPVKVQRNIVYYISGFLIYFAARAAALLMANLLPAADLGTISGVLMLIASGCLLAWAVGMRTEGETMSTVTGHRWNPQAIQRLTEQLDYINATVGRFSRL